ncbi:MAG: TonB-dependent receptor [Ignavibacteriae bacterium]|nr:TonB-dependent receptor [Ignavibacteriota bacterium]
MFINIINSSAQQGERGTIEGMILSSEDRQPVVAATILLKGTVIGTTSNEQGRFFLPNVPTGEYTLTVSMIGFKKKIIPGVVVKEREVIQILVELEPSAVQTDPVIITASKREQSLQEVPVTVNVVDDQLLSYRNTITISDALNYVPGVNMTRSQVNIRGTTGFSYGVGTRVLLLLDGLPLLSGDTKEIIWESIPIAQIERVEVVKGAGSALYGSSALGGVINVIPAFLQDQPETRFRMYGGFYEMPQYDSWRWVSEARFFSGVSLIHHQPIGTVNITAGGSRTLDDGFKRNDFWRRWNAWARIGSNISAHQAINLSFSVLEQRRGNFLYWKDLNHALEPKDDQLTQRVQSIRWSLSGSYKQFLSNSVYYSVKVSWFRSRWRDNISSNLDVGGSQSRSNAVDSDVQMIYQLTEENIVVGGLSGNYNLVEADTIFGDHTAQGGAFYVQDEIKFNKNIQLTLGGRFDMQQLDDLESVSQVNPKFGVVYNPSLTTRLRGSAGRGFRAPSVAEVFTTTEAGGLTILPNPALKPERSWSFELAGSRIFGEYVSADLVLFHNELYDLIEPAFGSDGRVHFQNITRARIGGLELVAKFSVSKRMFSGQLSYTHIKPEDLTKGDILKYRPRHLFYASSQISVPPFDFGVDFRYLSKVDRIDEELILLGVVPDGDKRVPIYVTDIRLGVDWKFMRLPLVTKFHINNLFQYYYVDFIGNLGPLRHYVLTLEAKL